MERGGRIIEVDTVQHLSAGALGLDVAGLLALVADLLATARVLGAVTREMTGLAAVVALGAVDAVARHVADTAARVAGLVLLETATAIAAGLITTTTSSVAVAALGAVAGNVADLAALVALSAGSTTAGTTSRGGLGAVTANVTSSSAAVACLGILGTLGAVTAHVTLATAVVALSSTTVGAVTGLMRGLAACEAGASAGLLLRSERIHLEVGIGGLWLR